MSSRERTARSLVAAKIVGVDARRLARERFQNEVLADALAAQWGFPCFGHTSGLERLRGFQDELAAVTELAAEIERELDTAEGDDR